MLLKRVIGYIRVFLDRVESMMDNSNNVSNVPVSDIPTSTDNKNVSITNKENDNIEPVSENNVDDLVDEIPETIYVDFDINNIICLNTISISGIQMFSLCVKYGFDISSFIDIKNKYDRYDFFSDKCKSNIKRHVTTGKVWIDLSISQVVAYEQYDSGKWVYRSGVQKFVYGKMIEFLVNYKGKDFYIDTVASIKPITTLKVPKHKEAILLYKKWLSEGFVEIQNDDLDKRLLLLEHSEKVCELDELKKLMNNAVMNEDYELAASLRDKIKELS